MDQYADETADAATVRQNENSHNVVSKINDSEGTMEVVEDAERDMKDLLRRLVFRWKFADLNTSICLVPPIKRQQAIRFNNN